MIEKILNIQENGFYVDNFHDFSDVWLTSSAFSGVGVPIFNRRSPPVWCAQVPTEGAYGHGKAN